MNMPCGKIKVKQSQIFQGLVLLAIATMGFIVSESHRTKPEDGDFQMSEKSAAAEYIMLSTPCLSGNEKKYVSDCMETEWISSVGQYVDRFEKDFARYVGAAGGAAAVSCGTAALHLALLTCGVRQGDLVFVPSLTFIAPVNSITYVGASPLFADSVWDGFGISPDSVQRYIDSKCEFRNDTIYDIQTGRRISAMIPVHLMGHSCMMDELLAICRRYNLVMIEDCAEGIGCLYKGRHVGNSGRVGCFSFNGNKTLTTGGGGMAVSQDVALRVMIKHLSTQAKSSSSGFEHDATGFNYRMNNIQAAIGVAQLEHVDAMIAEKRRIHAVYERELGGLSNGIELLKAPSFCTSAYWFATLRTENREMRNRILRHFEESRIQARAFWQLNHETPMYKGCPRADIVTAAAMQDTCVNIPCSAKMSESDVGRVIKAVRA